MLIRNLLSLGDKANAAQILCWIKFSETNSLLATDFRRVSLAYSNSEVGLIMFVSKIKCKLMILLKTILSVKAILNGVSIFL